MIARIMGSLFFIEAGFLILCSFLAVYYNESDLSAFLTSTAITVGAGIIASLTGKNAEKKISRRDGYVIVTFAWVFFSLFGMLPFYLSGYIPCITDAFFETMSGFTTTGASILNNIESLPHGLLFWRSMTQWIGGLGIVFSLLPYYRSSEWAVYNYLLLKPPAPPMIKYIRVLVLQPNGSGLSI